MRELCRPWPGHLDWLPKRQAFHRTRTGMLNNIWSTPTRHCTAYNLFIINLAPGLCSSHAPEIFKAYDVRGIVDKT